MRTAEWTRTVLRSAVAGLLSVLLAAAPTRAGKRARAPRMVHWASNAEMVHSDSMLTLAVVRGGRFARFELCDWDWGFPKVSRWRAVDTWGKFTGTLEMRNDDGNGQLRLLEGSRGVGVYVKQASGWSPPPAARWQPSGDERASFERWRTRLRDHKNARKPEVRFFVSREPRREFAVVKGFEHIWIAQLQSGAWQLVHDEHAAGMRWPGFALRVIMDMTGDGMPEVVYHFNEYADGLGHEVVLQGSNNGRSWREASNNADDCP